MELVVLFLGFSIVASTRLGLNQFILCWQLFVFGTLKIIKASFCTGVHSNNDMEYRGVGGGGDGFNSTSTQINSDGHGNVGTERDTLTRRADRDTG